MRSFPLPSFVQGISQQPDNVIQPGQLRDALNMMPDLARGCVRRPPTSHLAKVSPNGFTAVYTHGIYASPTEQFLLTVVDGVLTVRDQNGVLKTVVNEVSPNPPDLSYLTGPLKFLSIRDTTFILNTDVYTEIDPVTLGNVFTSAVLTVKTTANAAVINVYIDGVLKGTDTSGNTNTVTAATDLTTSLVAGLGAGWTVSRFENTILITKNSNGPFTCEVGDTLGGTSVTKLLSTVDLASNLPSICQHDKVVKVGGTSNGTAAYYVKFVADTAGVGLSTLAKGYWEEVAYPGARIDKDTMPLILVYDGSQFTLRAVTWNDRTAGDDATNPYPAFSQQKITDMALYRGRLAFSSGDTVSFSGANDLYNFFLETVQQTLPSQPIGVTAVHARGSTINHLVTYQDKLLLVCDQAVLGVASGQEAFSPTSVQSSLITSLAVGSTRPVPSGRSVYLPVRVTSANGALWELTDANPIEVSSHVPTLIEGEIVGLAEMSGDKLFVLSAFGDIFLYNTKLSGDQRVQSAWSRWSFSTEVLGITVFDSKLFLWVSAPDGLFIEEMDLASQADLGADYLTHVDRRISSEDLVGVFDGDNTTWTLPYAVSGYPSVVDKTNDPLTFHGTSGVEITVVGDYTTIPCWIGIRYDSQVTLPHLFPKLPDGSPKNSGKFQPTTIEIITHQSGDYSLEVSDRRHLGRTSREGPISDGLSNVKVPIRGLEVNITIKAVNDYPLNLVGGTVHGRWLK